MNNSFKINFEQLRQDNLKELFRILEEVLKAINIDYYVIGALAKDSWFAKEDIRSRTTKDFDIAVMISDRDQYFELRDKLIHDHDFVEVKTNDYALNTPFGYPIDILPFGDIEIDDEVHLKGEGLTAIRVNGFNEVYRKGIIPVQTDEEFEFQVATLPSLVLLKLIAYDDRPEQRFRDITDITNIITHFFDIESNMIYDKHNDLFEYADLDLIDYSAIVIGREISSIIKGNDKLKERLLNILKLDKHHSKLIPDLMAGVKELGLTVEKATTLLNEISDGIKE
ncbi:MAG TPA: nucleotidyl transferase AbiEii/AbiGii toxin family protein [Balneolales bacterium]|nr:nucleotidyl transferase AbiEii/AbiGii toxin family protein [Balneolales bacterium]